MTAEFQTHEGYQATLDLLEEENATLSTAVEHLMKERELMHATIDHLTKTVKELRQQLVTNDLRRVVGGRYTDARED